MFDKLYCFNCDKIKNEYRIPQILKIHPLKNKLGDDKETSWYDMKSTQLK